MTPESKKQLAALVMQYGAETVAKAAESVTISNKAPLILLNKAQSLPMDDRAPFYQFAAERLAKSDEDAWEACRAWDNSAACGGRAGLGRAGQSRQARRSVAGNGKPGTGEARIGEASQSRQDWHGTTRIGLVRIGEAG